MITQKVPQSLKEAVDSIEEQLKAGGDMATSNLVMFLTFSRYASLSVIFSTFGHIHRQRLCACHLAKQNPN